MDAQHPWRMAWGWAGDVRPSRPRGIEQGLRDGDGFDAADRDVRIPARILV
jgi:hypothetical protein